MPFVKIDLFEGRSQEQKNELAREVTEVARQTHEETFVFRKLDS